MEKVPYNKEDSGSKSNSVIDMILRQELTSLTPNCNVKCAVICNLILIMIFVSLGVPIVVLSNSIIEYHVDYTNW